MQSRTPQYQSCGARRLPGTRLDIMEVVWAAQRPVSTASCRSPRLSLTIRKGTIRGNLALVLRKDS